MSSRLLSENYYHQKNYDDYDDTDDDDDDDKKDIQVPAGNWTRGEVELEKGGRWRQLVIFGRIFNIQ